MEPVCWKAAKWSLEDILRFSSGFSYVCVGFDFEGDRHFFRKTIKLYNFLAVATQNSSKEKLDDIVFWP